MRCSLKFYDKKTTQNRTAPIHIYLFYIIYINNLILYEVSGQPNVTAFQFHVKNDFVWLNTKSKVQNLIHFSISHFHKINSSKSNIITLFYIYIYIYILICGPFSLLSIHQRGSFFFLVCVLYIFVLLFLLHKLYYIILYI